MFCTNDKNSSVVLNKIIFVMQKCQLKHLQWLVWCGLQGVWNQPLCIAAELNATTS